MVVQKSGYFVLSLALLNGSVRFTLYLIACQKQHFISIHTYPFNILNVKQLLCVPTFNEACRDVEAADFFGSGKATKKVPLLKPNRTAILWTIYLQKINLPFA